MVMINSFAIIFAEKNLNILQNMTSWIVPIISSSRIRIFAIRNWGEITSAVFSGFHGFPHLFGYPSRVSLPSFFSARRNHPWPSHCGLSGPPDRPDPRAPNIERRRRVRWAKGHPKWAKSHPHQGKTRSKVGFPAS